MTLRLRSAANPHEGPTATMRPTGITPGRRCWLYNLVGTRIRNYVLSVDLGQAEDPTAIALLEWSDSVWGIVGQTYAPVDLSEEEVIYKVTGLERLPLNTSYPNVVKRVRYLYDSTPLK